MGTTYHLGCTECREQIWIGQRGAGRDKLHVYSTDKHLNLLDAFLDKHLGHLLIFHNHHYFDDLDHTDREYRWVKDEELTKGEKYHADNEDRSQ